MADQSLVVWGRASSSNVQKVLWALAEMALPYERFDAGGRYGVTDTDDYIRMNPNQRVPTIVDGDLVMYESNAIVRYLARKHGGVLLADGAPHTLAIADQWMDWAANHFTGAMSAVFWAKVRTPKDKVDQAALATQLGLVQAGARIMDARLANSPWLGGAAFSMADIPAGAWMYRYYDIDIDRDALPNLQRWYDALSERPAFSSTVQTSYEELRVN